MAKHLKASFRMENLQSTLLHLFLSITIAFLVLLYTSATTHLKHTYLQRSFHKTYERRNN